LKGAELLEAAEKLSDPKLSKNSSGKIFSDFISQFFF
jgi:hypothetical protein